MFGAVLINIQNRFKLQTPFKVIESEDVTSADLQQENRAETRTPAPTLPMKDRGRGGASRRCVYTTDTPLLVGY